MTNFRSPHPRPGAPALATWDRTYRRTRQILGDATHGQYTRDEAARLVAGALFELWAAGAVLVEATARDPRAEKTQQGGDAA